MVQRSVGAKSFSASQLQKIVSDGKNKHIKYILYKCNGVIQNFWKTLSHKSKNNNKIKHETVHKQIRKRGGETQIKITMSCYCFVE